MRNLTFYSPFSTPAAYGRTNFWNEIEGLLERGGSEGQSTAQTFEPRADIEETETAFKLLLDLPGVKETDVELKLEDRKLTLKAKREQSEERKTSEGVRRERFFGEFVRSFKLPQNVDTSAIEAKMKNGVLEVTVPKTADTQPKTIPVTLS